MTDARTAPTEVDDHPPPEPPVRVGLLIGVLVGAAFVMIFNETVLNVALHDLTIDLGVSTATVQWLTSGVLLTMAAIIPTTGFLLERFTPRQVFVMSLASFSAGTAICAVAPGFGVLMAGRVVQGIGTAVMLPMLIALVMRLVPPQRRGTTMGTITIVIAAAPAVGPVLGGAILQGLGWRWMFGLVLPFALAALAAGGAWLRMPASTRAVPLDVASVLLAALGFGGLVYGLSAIGAGAGAAPDPQAWAALALGVLALAVFVARQLRLQRADRALLDLRPFTRPTYAASALLTVALFVCLVGVPAILLLYLRTVANVNAVVSGLIVLPGGLVLAGLSRPVGVLFDRYGARPLVLPGAIIAAAALWSFVTFGPGTPMVVVVVLDAVLMLGVSLMMSPVLTAALIVLPEHLHGHGSAMLATLQQLAGALGTAVLVSVAAIAGPRVAFVVAGFVGLVAVAAAAFVRTTPQAPAVPADPVDATDAAPTEAIGVRAADPA